MKECDIMLETQLIDGTPVAKLKVKKVFSGLWPLPKSMQIKQCLNKFLRQNIYYKNKHSLQFHQKR